MKLLLVKSRWAGSVWNVLQLSNILSETSVVGSLLLSLTFVHDNGSFYFDIAADSEEVNIFANTMTTTNWIDNTQKGLRNKVVITKNYIRDLFSYHSHVGLKLSKLPVSFYLDWDVMGSHLEFLIEMTNSDTWPKDF